MKSLRLQWIIALAASLTATARPPQGPQGHGGPPPPPIPPLFAVFDTDRNQELSAEEIAAAAAALGKLDRNQDGEVSLQEAFMPPPEEKKPRKKANNENRPDPENRPGPPLKRPVPPIIEALDLNKDGTITADELASASESLKTLDKDGDGTLSPAEIHPHGPPPPMGGKPPVE
jgi:hypothetical protein